MADAIRLILGLGVFLGLLIGRWRAENARARYDMNRTWDGRKNYRGE
ncbi:MAG: hypothetical protein ACRDRK_20305 [Pseudonocardia sp.]